jgi:Beta-galactosidase
VTNPSLSLPGARLGVATGFLYGYQGAPAYEFGSEIGKLGAELSKVYFFWNQIEPEKGRYDWTAVDKFVEQLDSPENGLIAVFSSSQWATKRPAAILPPSPAKNPSEYFRFIFELVRHCGGRVRFWQNDAEPSNPVFWGGSKEEFIEGLKVFYQAVKAADPKASVVVGGYDGLFGPPGTHQFPNQQAGLDFFDYVLKKGQEAFDIFDLRLYGDPYTIPARVDFMRQKMLALGYDKPIICTEYGGPNLFEFPENRKYVPLVAVWSQEITNSEGDSSSSPITSARNALEQLYRNIDVLPPQTQMFMAGCSPELEAKYQRIQARGIVMRNVFAFSAGVQKTIYWQLPRIPQDGEARFHIMALMYGKIGLLHFEHDTLGNRYPSGDTFQRMSNALRGLQRVEQIAIANPSIFLFEVIRERRPSCYVLWERRDAFSGEDAPPIAFDLPWTASETRAFDALGRAVPVTLKDKMLHLEVSLTPIFIERDET